MYCKLQSSHQVREPMQHVITLHFVWREVTIPAQPQTDR